MKEENIVHLLRNIFIEEMYILYLLGSYTVGTFETKMFDEMGKLVSILQFICMVYSKLYQTEYVQY